MTEAFISAIRTHPQLPQRSWYFISSVTLSALNRPEEIATLYTHAIEKGVGKIQNQPGEDEKLQISRKLREALVKSSAICGLPKVGVISSIYNRFRQLSTIEKTDHQLAIGTQEGHATIATG